jgi:hypothetical protein
LSVVLSVVPLAEAPVVERCAQPEEGATRDPALIFVAPLDR